MQDTLPSVFAEVNPDPRRCGERKPLSHTRVGQRHLAILRRSGPLRQPENRPAHLPQPSDSCPDVDPCPPPPLVLPVLSEDTVRQFQREVDLRQISRTPQHDGGLPGRVIVPGARTPRQQENE